MEWVGLAQLLGICGTLILRELGSYFFALLRCVILVFLHWVAGDARHDKVVFVLFGTFDALSHATLSPCHSIVFFRVSHLLVSNYLVDLFLHLHDCIHHRHFSWGGLLLMNGETSLDQIELLFEHVILLSQFVAVLWDIFTMRPVVNGTCHVDELLQNKTIEGTVIGHFCRCWIRVDFFHLHLQILLVGSFWCLIIVAFSFFVDFLTLFDHLLGIIWIV